MKKLSFLLLALSLCLIGLRGSAAEFPAPVQGMMVSDYAKLFSEAELNTIEARLRAFNDTTSTQIAVLTVNDLEGYSASGFAIRTAEQWGIGAKQKDNGVLILVKPKNETKGEVFIAVGYGLEGALPDAIAKRIIDRLIIPEFRQNNYYEGVLKGVNAVIGFVSGEFAADQPDTKKRGINGYLILIIFAFICIVGVIGAKNKNKNKNKNGDKDDHYGGRGGHIPPIIFFGGGGGGRSSGFGGGGSGFGGFGGGSFGGGGAGGSW